MQVNIPLSFVNHSSQSLEPEEGIMGNSDLQPVNQKHS